MARPARKGGRSSAAVAAVGEWLHYLGIKDDWRPEWPPDVFGVSAAFLRRTGGYVQLINGHPLQALGPSERKADAVGEAWRQAYQDAFRKGKTPVKLGMPEIFSWFAMLRSAAYMSFEEAASDMRVQMAALNLCVASDAACKDIGLSMDRDDYFLSLANAMLTINRHRSFCVQIKPEKLAVLGKQHTPQRGCTIRSLSHNLSLHVPFEIETRWKMPMDRDQGEFDTLNLLLLPWPVSVSPADFSSMTPRTGEGNPMSFRYFEYSPAPALTPAALARAVAKAMDDARDHANRIHGVVFPEAALSEAEYFAVERVVAERDAMLIAGVRLTPDGPSRMGGNVCILQPLGLTSAGVQESLLEQMRQVQHKHHRWCLDEGQVLQYGLGGRLAGTIDSWERMSIQKRAINFVTLSGWLTICGLICEDLARQEPVADVVRSIGPNLVIALLMDGPQLRERWSSRYASVLAEDPGCSVLSLTSLGMARRSWPGGNRPVQDRSSVIALWRDAKVGEREISVDAGHDACVLSLACRTGVERTLDDRADDTAHFPVFAGSYSFRAYPSPRKSQAVKKRTRPKGRNQVDG